MTSIEAAAERLVGETPASTYGDLIPEIAIVFAF
jgi:hypothetical protein